MSGPIGPLDTYLSGDPSTNLYLRKGQVISPAVVQPSLTILSASGLQAATISTSNSGLTEIVAPGQLDITSAANVEIMTDSGLKVSPVTQADGAGTITLFNGTGSSNPTYYTMYNTALTGGGNTAGEFAMFGYSGSNYTTIRRCMGVTAVGSVIDVGDATAVGGASLLVNGPSGASRVLDATYNPPTTINSIQSGSGNIVVFSSGARPAGKYMVQLYATNVVPNAGTTLQLFALNGSTSIPYSATSIRDTEVVSGSSEIVLSSGIFTWGGSGTITIQAQASAGNWTSTDWAAQIIKIA